MEAFSQDERIAALERMARDGVDVFVIGGGITGVSVALDAAARGCRVGLAEKADFASGTSSKSTKLVHGGIRYLPQFDFALVREALVERGLLFRNAPWIVRPLAFVLPLYRWNRRPLGAPFVPPFGLAVGFWKDTSEIRANWSLDRRFEPTMGAAEREKSYAGWQRAVARAQAWEQP